jgi:hypothetical protein|tara:strand:- start:604 stop:747 length:144 start_codon:yes stop_codon:yes gene_type:complete
MMYGAKDGKRPMKRAMNSKTSSLRKKTAKKYATTKVATDGKKGTSKS